jgi:hypothetical protein
MLQAEAGPVADAMKGEADVKTSGESKADRRSPRWMAVRGWLWKVATGQATREQAKDTGMAAVLVLLIIALAQRSHRWMAAAMVVHVINMTAPQIFRPAAVIWFGFSHLLGAVVSTVVLAAIFFGVVTPLAVVRRLMGADSLRLKAFKAGRTTVMRERNHTFVGKDLEQPY